MENVLEINYIIDFAYIDVILNTRMWF